MRNPYLNYPRLVSLAQRIKRTPTYIKSEDVKDWELEDLLIWIDQERREHYVMADGLARANETTIDRWPFNPALERLEQAVKGELERRGAVVAAPIVEQVVRHEIQVQLLQPPPPPKKEKASAPPPEKVLPELEKVLRFPERLPFLWEHLEREIIKTKRVSDLFDSTGYVGSSDRNLSPLFGVCEGLRICGQIKEGFTAKDVYKILCSRFNVVLSSEPHKARKYAIFKDVRRWVEDFYGKV